MSNNPLKLMLKSKSICVAMISFAALITLIFAVQGTKQPTQEILQVTMEETQWNLPARFFTGLSEGRMYHCVINTLVDYGDGKQSSIMEQSIEGMLNIRLLPEEKRRVENAEIRNTAISNAVPVNVVLAAQFSELSVTITINGQVRKFEPRVLELLERMFLVTMSRRGGVVDFDFHPSVPSQLTSILEGGFHSLQILLPGPGDAHSGGGAVWRTVERDTNGEYLSSYRTNHNGTIWKRRLSYSSPRNEGGQISLRMSILSSDIRAEVDNGWIKNLNVHERSELFTETSTRIAAGENSVTLELLPFSPDSKDFIWRETRTAEQIRGRFQNERNAMLAERQRMDLRPVEATEGKREIMYEVELAQRFVPGLTTEHSRLTELVAWLNANPDAALVVPGMMLKIGDDSLHNYIILALQLSGTPHAQSALCSIFAADSQLGRMNRLRAITTFSFVNNPTEDSIRALRNAADTLEDEYASTALLALGGSAFRVREAEPGRYAPLFEDIKRRLQTAQERKEPDNERVALLAIGNVHDASFLPQVTPYLKGDDPAYREIAAGTLQHMRGAEVLRLLEERVELDPEIRVRRAAAKSLAEHPADPQTVDFVIGRINREKDAAVQTELARYLGRAASRNRDQNARTALEGLWNTSNNRDVLRVVRDVRKGRTP